MQQNSAALIYDLSTMKCTVSIAQRGRSWGEEDCKTRHRTLNDSKIQFHSGCAFDYIWLEMQKKVLKLCYHLLHSPLKFD